MKKLLIFAAVLLSACSPQMYRVYMDVRQPSSSGLDLAGKSMAVVYMDGPEKADSLVNSLAAQSLALSLEKDYFGGEEVVGLFTSPASSEVTLDAMHRLVMETGEDVVFLISSVPEVLSGTSIHVYDSMGSDNVFVFDGSKPSVFLSNWMTQTFTFYWFDDFHTDEWLLAISRVEEGKFTEAISIWEKFLKKGNELKAAHACYNTAMAFYLMGDMDLATRWLDEALKFENVEAAPVLRKRIAAHLEK